MTATYSVKCECGAVAVGALVSDSSVPLYACGNWGGRQCRLTVPWRDQPYAVSNVVALTADDAAALAKLNTLVIAARWSPPLPGLPPVAVVIEDGEEGCNCPIVPDPPTILHEYGCGRHDGR